MKPPDLTDLVKLWLIDEGYDIPVTCSDAGVLRRVGETEVIGLILEDSVFFAFDDPQLRNIQAADPLFFPKLRRLLTEI